MEINLFWILFFSAILFYIFKKNGIKPERKFLGGALILLGAIFISPIPDPTDTIGFAIFSVWKGIDLNINNISVYFLEYTLLTLSIGAILIFTGMKILGWDIQRVLKKLDIGKYKIAIGIAIFAVLAIALFDIWSMNSGVFGTPEDYLVGNYTPGWWDLYFKFVLMFFALPAISYYFLVRQDKSEALGIFGSSIIMFFGGLADIGFFIFQKIPIPDELPWLVGSPFINFISTTVLGYPTVTNISLLVSVLLSFILAWGFAKVMKEKF